MAYVQFNNYIEPDSTSNESSVTNEKISQETRMKKVSHKHLTAKSTKNYLNSCLDLLDNISNLVNKLKEEELSRIKKQKIKRINGISSTSQRKFKHSRKRVQRRSEETIEIRE